MKDTVQRTAAASRTIPIKLNASGILALFLGAMIFITSYANASNHLCQRAQDRCDTQTQISDRDCRNIARNDVCTPEANGNGKDARDGYRYLKRRTR